MNPVKKETRKAIFPDSCIECGVLITQKNKGDWNWCKDCTRKYNEESMEFMKK